MWRHTLLHIRVNVVACEGRKNNAKRCHFAYSCTVIIGHSRKDKLKAVKYIYRDNSIQFIH